jgi:hypothetical protein
MAATSENFRFPHNLDPVANLALRLMPDELVIG